jgi:Pyruvate/2-oxoacid:ferredoxin oxidoreductase gamma subunit
MERELLLTGIGGQGVQLAAQVIARAASREGRPTMLFGVYSGMMRGGNSDSTVVVGDGAAGAGAGIEAPPLVSHAWSAIVMHHKYWEPMVAKLQPGAVVVVNSSLFEGSADRTAWRVFDVPATDVAAELGNPMAASMALAGAYVGLTGLVELDSLVEGMRESIPAYRRQHVEANEAAIRAGFDRVERLAAPAWATTDALSGGRARC